MSHTQAILIIARCFSATYNIILLNIVKWNTFVMSYPKETLIIALYFFYASNLISSGVVGWPEFSWLTCQPSETSAAECSSLKSPLASLLCHLMERSIYRRGRARERPVENTDADDPNFPGHGLQQGRLWGPEDDDIRGFEAWSSVRDCYNEALGKTPNHLSVICSPTIDMQSQYSIQSLYAPTSWSWAHNPWLNGLSELDFNSHRQNYGNVKTGTMARVSVNLRFQQHSTSGKPSPKFRLLGHLPLDFRSNSDLKSRRLNWMRHTKWFLKYCLLSFFPSLAYVATAAAIPSHHNFALDSRQVEVPGSDDGGLAWFWYLTIVASILVGEFTAAYILKDPLLLHGVSMGLSAASYLLMVFGQDKIPFHTQISTWGMCAILTITWTYYDTLNLPGETRRLAILAIIVIAVLLDTGISSAFGSRSSSMVAPSDSPSTAFIFSTFLLPCIALSSFLRSGTQSVYHQIIQHYGRTTT